MSDILNTLIQNIKHYRSMLNLSQSELADIAGIDRSHLASIEGGGQSNPTLKTVEKLSKALQVSIIDLLSEK